MVDGTLWMVNWYLVTIRLHCYYDLRSKWTRNSITLNKYSNFSPFSYSTEGFSSRSLGLNPTPPARLCSLPNEEEPRRLSITFETRSNKKVSQIYLIASSYYNYLFHGSKQRKVKKDIRILRRGRRFMPEEVTEKTTYCTHTKYDYLDSARLVGSFLMEKVKGKLERESNLFY